jgi:ribonuclease P protein component
LTVGRLHERRAFERLTRDGADARTRDLWCRYLPEPGIVPPQVAYSVGRSVGTAVVRNRVRRRLRAAVAAVAGSPLLPHGWLLVGARPSSSERTFDELRQDVCVMLGAMAGAHNRVNTGPHDDR